MIKDESPDQTSATQHFDESETVQTKRAGADGILNLISNFLESAGNVLLIQGPPGAGKTTLALELLQRVQATRMGSTVVPPARFYVPSRIPPNKLRKHFPWIHEMHDPFSKMTSPDSSMEGSAEIQVSEADDVFNKVLTLKRSRLRGLIVIDSWEGALRNTSEDGRRMIESAILSDPDDNRVGVVLVSEGGRVGELPNLVDGIVTLSSSELDGRRMRTIVVNKLRGLRVKSDRALFSLDKGKYNLLANTKFDDDASAKPNILSPVPHTQSSFSTGSRDLDAMLKGGIRRASSILVHVNNTVPTMGVRLLQVYGDSLMRPSLANIGARMRDAGAVTLAVASDPNKITEAFLRTADYYLKIESINDTMVVYGVKPFTNVHGVEFAFDKGYPSLKLTEIV